MKSLVKAEALINSPDKFFHYEPLSTRLVRLRRVYPPLA